MPESKPFQRLPKTVIPEHYVITLTPNLKSFHFEGHVSIRLRIVSATQKIILNTVDLTIDKVAVQRTDSDGGIIKPVSITTSEEDDTATFDFPRELEVGTYDLEISYIGEVNNKMKGLYRSKCVNSNGEEKYSAVTQFEATDARRCFPCWDEPAIKATFDIILEVESGLTAVSNMPVKSVTPIEGGLMKYTFNTTPKMSTYLVAIIIGDYAYEESRSGSIVVRVYAPPDKISQAQFALQISPDVLSYYNNYFSVTYPLPKMDLAAIADFSAGAMENWGLVTYRETCLLMDPRNPSASRKQFIALVVAHEFAHQWFGNLVTMEWWTHLWLNEGFATFMEYLCIHKLFPEFDIWSQFVTDTYIRALELDALKNSHPIEVPVGHPSEIDEIFDDISYNKGASVIRMLHQYIGDDDFKKGMHLYLTKHQYSNTETEDLWTSLQEASGKPVAAVMSSWTRLVGFPLVTASLKFEENEAVLFLTQEKFCADGSIEKNSPRWMIPISVSTCKSPGIEEINTVLESHETKIVIKDLPKDGWVKINVGTIGFYRTQYSADMLRRFTPAISNQSLPPLDRLGLLDDLLANVQAGRTPTSEVLRLLLAFQNETNYTVWSSIHNCLSKLSVILSNTEYYDAFTKYARNLLSGISKRLGWESGNEESHSNTLLRSLILSQLIWFDDVENIKKGVELFERRDHRAIPVDLKGVCYRAALRAGDANTLDSLLNVYRTTNLQEEKDRIKSALGCLKDDNLLSRALDFSMSDDVRSQDSVFIITAIAASRQGRKLAWEFVKARWPQLSKQYQGLFLLTILIKLTTENFATFELAKEVEEFFKDQPTPIAERTIQQSIESIQLNAAWLTRDLNCIKEFFDSEIAISI